MKRALVTGGTGAIGQALCQQLAADGLNVIIHTHQRWDEAHQLAEKIRLQGGQAEVVAFDLTQPEPTHQALDQLLTQGPIQVLVNNAGFHDDAAFPAMRPEQWQQVIDVALKGFFNVTQPLILPMVRSRWGRIVTVSSVAGLLGNRGQTNYAAAKAALHGATKSLALELASRQITVNAVAPGIIQSAMSEAAFDSARIKQLVPMKRAGTPEEVAHLVAFLVSEKSTYITGQILSIDGGMT